VKKSVVDNIGHSYYGELTHHISTFNSFTPEFDVHKQTDFEKIILLFFRIAHEN
jgi:hypothetical protein